MSGGYEYRAASGGNDAGATALKNRFGCEQQQKPRGKYRQAAAPTVAGAVAPSQAGESDQGREDQ